MPINSFGQEIGMPLPHYTSGEQPSLETIQGQTVRLEKLSLRHADDLYQFYGPNAKKSDWTYLPIDPFADRVSFQAYFQQMMASFDPYYLAIVDKATNQAIGSFALMRIDPTNRVIEVGWVIFSHQLQRTRQATEAHYLLMNYVFEELGYRRYEWKCDSLNQASRAAANRLGFTYEGTFRQALVYKGRNRDTAWFSLLDHEWPDRKRALENWLKDSNFDGQGQQKQSLSSF
ncbi:TPA: GNAT family N-acetyltransferase [Streptococcus suis]|uniref:GNAT family N-acetyltransferase n=1 Tax=Streptococcus suis TaxID=1307 RepID=UPI0005CE9C2C|nr:GNAT family protein [Streptococcus suis]MCK3895115.1 GNAT family N-acetyltransferase [Streptococcus suis]NQH66521.1 GNAT family N-acetyltransferase [Streptococcus suis]NQI37366.1 GNAT family N-acetyltransferase [Streptococcus suis]NQI39579.1 GNAT family N-acetyltransferase [Streptococcus suis]NQI49034.1 GNAT family N-acetyltransferase [Streptococcus suis]